MIIKLNGAGHGASKVKENSVFYVGHTNYFRSQREMFWVATKTLKRLFPAWLSEVHVFRGKKKGTIHRFHSFILVVLWSAVVAVRTASSQRIFTEIKEMKLSTMTSASVPNAGTKVISQKNASIEKTEKWKILNRKPLQLWLIDSSSQIKTELNIRIGLFTQFYQNICAIESTVFGLVEKVRSAFRLKVVRS